MSTRRAVLVHDEAATRYAEARKLIKEGMTKKQACINVKLAITTYKGLYNKEMAATVAAKRAAEKEQKLRRSNAEVAELCRKAAAEVVRGVALKYACEKYDLASSVLRRYIDLNPPKLVNVLSKMPADAMRGSMSVQQAQALMVVPNGMVGYSPAEPNGHHHVEAEHDNPARGRTLQVLRMVAEGVTATEACQQLGITMSKYFYWQAKIKAEVAQQQSGPKDNKKSARIEGRPVMVVAKENRALRSLLGDILIARELEYQETRQQAELRDMTAQQQNGD